MIQGEQWTQEGVKALGFVSGLFLIGVYFLSRFIYRKIKGRKQ